MKFLPVVALSALVALAACEKPKPPPARPVATAPAPPIPPMTPAPILSGNLARRDQMPSFTLDRIGAAFDPINRKPAVTPGDKPILLFGFGFDPVANTPAKGVDVAIDGKLYPTAYGSPRPDVGRYTRNDGLVNVGFTGAVPANALDSGEHILTVRVIAADGSGYFESPQLKFEVQ
jgi:hypothetical protein